MTPVSMLFIAQARLRVALGSSEPATGTLFTESEAQPPSQGAEAVQRAAGLKAEHFCLTTFSTPS